MSEQQATAYMVDTSIVDRAQLLAFDRLLMDDAIPRMRAAGATLEDYRTTSIVVGEPVEVELTWSFPGLTAWNEIRRTLVLDPGYYACAEQLAGLRVGGRRRFLWSRDSGARLVR